MQPSGNAIVIEAEPVNKCPTCRQSKVIRNLVDLPIIGYPTRLYVRLPHWPFLRARQFKNH
ncbi:hypothetical protein FRC0508_02137 [Corynebacterium diphtheriae]|nr:hypothetical protein FRC0049_02064 [Corynebacterium diphtheriae]CAB0713884.1 hypothetical protein FRC0050_02087 [Corynebacterium diphtheriae]CAB1009844.1 hypothetical protein FRC0508_02137 [Corynebacterium diphtheriae]